MQVNVGRFDNNFVLRPEKRACFPFFVIMAIVCR